MKIGLAPDGPAQASQGQSSEDRGLWTGAQALARQSDLEA